MGLRESVYDALNGDSTLMALLDGGLHTAVEISRQNTPGAFDANKELLPCALLKFSTETPFGPFTHSARTLFNLMFYQRVGYDVINAARERAYALLHYQKIGEDVWEIDHADDVLDARDDALDVALVISRYYAIRLKG